ncbi:MAG: hypothetical protein GY719_31670 [bacterium]|nr:hypothetical protein [bacterium]
MTTNEELQKDSTMEGEQELVTEEAPPEAADDPTPPPASASETDSEGGNNGAVDNGGSGGQGGQGDAGEDDDAAPKYDEATLGDIRRLAVYLAMLSVGLLVSILVLWPRTDHLPGPPTVEDLILEMVEEVSDRAESPPERGSASEPADDILDATPAAAVAEAAAESSPLVPSPPPSSPAAGAAPSVQAPPPSTGNKAVSQSPPPAEAEEEPSTEEESSPWTKRILLLVVLVGMLGSVIGAISSFVSYVGNGTFKVSWLWWYLLRPLMGSMLGLLLYLVAQAGFLPSPRVALDEGELEKLIYQAVAIAGLAGMFSKVTADKLEEIFATILQSSTDESRKHKLTEEDDSE